MNYKKYDKIFKMSQEELAKQLVLLFSKNNFKVIYEPGSYVFIEGNNKECLVAHLDTVHSSLPKDINYEIDIDGTEYVSAKNGIGADDRCGIIAAIEIFKARDKNSSILFTFDEEIGGLGVKKFVSSKTFEKLIQDESIHVFIEFDRKGSNDYVTYGNDNFEVDKILESVGFKKSHGTYSDIADLSKASGIASVNISTGYYNAHRDDEFYVPIVLNRNINRILSVLDDLVKEIRTIDMFDLDYIDLLFTDEYEEFEEEEYDKYIQEQNQFEF